MLFNSFMNKNCTVLTLVELIVSGVRLTAYKQTMAQANRVANPGD